MKRTALIRKTPMARAKPLSSAIRTSNAIAPSAPTLAAKPRMRKCAVCKAPFIKRSMTHKACGPECAQALARQVREKAERMQLAERRLAAKPRAKWQQEAQAEFNSWVRWRDRNLPCISCGRFHQGSWDAGHYRSVGSMPALRFHEDNCHRQCVPCNQHKSGNAVEYRLGLIARIGAERVAFLEGPHDLVKNTIDDFKAIKAHYRAKLKVEHAKEKPGISAN
jgi:hypothetical protein